MIVPGFGPPSAKIIFIGEAPGEEEDRTGIPFTGSSGKFLNSLLIQTGINRHECYFTNVVKTRPPGNNFGIYYVDTKKTQASPMLLESYRELHSELRNLRPNVIVCLGSESLRAITGKTSIEKWRGSIIPSSFGKVIGTYHPAYLMRDAASTPVAVHDLERVREESEYPEIRDLGHVLEINPSYQRVVEYLSDLLARPRPVSFDIETTRGETTHVRCIALADSSKHALCIPFMSYQQQVPSKTTISLGLILGVNSHWTEEEEYEILRLLDRIFSSSEIPKIAQNFPFDSQVLGREFGFSFSGLSLDTLVAAHTMYPELPKGLDFLASLYTKVPYYSDYDPSVDLELWRYNCLDAVVTWEIAEVLRSDLSERKLAKARPYSSLTFQLDHIQPAMTAYTRIGQRGVLCDIDVRDKLKVDMTLEMESFRQKISLIAGGDLNPASNKQMGEYLYDKLKLPVQRNRKTGEQTVDENAINFLSNKYPSHGEFFSNLLEWRERSKLISTYLEIPLTPDKRITTSFNCVGTVNGRCNSSRTLWGLGTNLQNIPKRSALGRKLRAMFISDPGHVLIKADLSQAQFRAVCWLGKMERLYRRYLDNPKFDVHRWVASLIYKVEEDAVTDDQRNIAKNGVYGGTFHMMPKTAAVTYKIPLDQATFVLNAFWKALPEIPLWWKQVEYKINTTRTLVTPLGRVRSFMGRIDDSLYRDAYAFCPQGIEADIIHRAVILMELLLERFGAKTVLQIHDEVVISCPESQLGNVLPIVKNLLEYPIHFDDIKEPMIIPSDVSFGKNWLDQTKWKG